MVIRPVKHLVALATFVVDITLQLSTVWSAQH